MKIKHLITILTLTISAFSVANTPTNSTTGILKQVPKSEQGKRAPSMTFIECESINRMLIFNSNFEYEFMYVTVEGSNNDNIIEGTITPTEPYIFLPSSLEGTYTIRCTTDGGAVYEGTITL